MNKSLDIFYLMLLVRCCCRHLPVAILSKTPTPYLPKALAQATASAPTFLILSKPP